MATVDRERDDLLSYASNLTATRETLPSSPVGTPSTLRLPVNAGVSRQGFHEAHSGSGWEGIRVHAYRYRYAVRALVDVCPRRGWW